MRICVAWLLACYFLLSWHHTATAQTITIRNASLQASTRAAPALSIPSQVSLPHRWDKSFPRQEGTATYLLDMPALSATSSDVVLYIPRLGNQVQLFMRRAGQREALQSFGTLSKADFDAAKSPQWIALPANLKLPSGTWQLEIQMTAQSGRYAGLSSVSYGDAAALRPAYAKNYFWRQTSSQIIVLSLGFLGLLAAGFWWRLREPSFGLFAITAVLGLIRMSDRLMPQTFLHWPWWGAMMSIAYSWHMLFMIAFCLHIAGCLQRFQRIVLMGWMAGTAAMALLAFGLSQSMFWTAALISHAVPGVYALFSLVRRWRQDRHREALLLGLCGLLLIGVGMRDFLAVRLANSEELTFSFMPVALFAFVLTMAWIIIERYSRQVQDYRELNTSLESRVAQRDLQLSESYKLLKVTDDEKATLAERARIMRDIHDGVGAQLVGLVSMLQSDEKRPEELREHAQHALDELRMAVDSLQPVEGSLSTVLATLRYRLQPRLKAAGIDVQWEVDELPKLDTLTPNAVLQVQRILLEAFTNVIRHSGASIVQVRAMHVIQEGGFQRLSLCVDDNGKPATPTTLLASDFSSQAHPDIAAGHGQTNMRWRANSIGAELHIESSPLGGMRVRLEWVVSTEQRTAT